MSDPINNSEPNGLSTPDRKERPCTFCDHPARYLYGPGEGADPLCPDCVELFGFEMEELDEVQSDH